MTTDATSPKQRSPTSGGSTEAPQVLVLGGAYRVNGSRGDSGRAQPIASIDRGAADPLLTKRLLTVTDLCRLLGMSRRWVHERTRRHEIPCYRFGTALRFDLDEILRWMAHFHAAHSTPRAAETWES